MLEDGHISPLGGQGAIKEVIIEISTGKRRKEEEMSCSDHQSLAWVSPDSDRADVSSDHSDGRLPVSWFKFSHLFWKQKRE